MYSRCLTDLLLNKKIAHFLDNWLFIRSCLAIAEFLLVYCCYDNCPFGSMLLNISKKSSCLFEIFRKKTSQKIVAHTLLLIKQTECKLGPWCTHLAIWSHLTRFSERNLIPGQMFKILPWHFYRVLKSVFSNYMAWAGTSH